MRLFIPILATGRQGAQGVFTRSLTIDHTQVTSTQTNFPVLVNFTNTTFKTIANGGHVAATNAFTFSSDSAGASLLTWEVERYDATTGEIVAWVKIASVSSASDTVFYLRYGGTITTDQSDPTNVWTNSYLGVYHLKDGTTLSVADSLNTNNGTNHGATAATGQIDGCASFASASSQYIDCGTGMNTASMTYSAWVNATSFPNAYNAAIGRSATNDYFILMVKSTGKLACYAFAGGDVSYDGTGTNTLSTGTWYYLAMTYLSAANPTGGLIGYVNGASDHALVGANSLDLNTSVARTDIGQDANTAGRFWNGLLDEGRASSVARSGDWISLEYNNQKPSSTLVTLGAET